MDCFAGLPKVLNSGIVLKSFRVSSDNLKHIPQLRSFGSSGFSKQHTNRGCRPPLDPQTPSPADHAEVRSADVAPGTAKLPQTKMELEKEPFKEDSSLHYT